MEDGARRRKRVGAIPSDILAEAQRQRALLEACLFIKNETNRNYIAQAQKTWRKHNAAMILATQSIRELEESGMLAIVAASCPNKMFLANPKMNRQACREAFHLNDAEIDIIADLISPGEMLIG